MFLRGVRQGDGTSQCWSHWLWGLVESGLTHFPGGFPSTDTALSEGTIMAFCLHLEFWYTWEHLYSVPGNGHLGTWQVPNIWYSECSFCLGIFCTRILTRNSLSSQIQTLSHSDWSCLVLDSGLLIAFIKKSGLCLRIHHLTCLLKRSYVHILYAHLNITA